MMRIALAALASAAFAGCASTPPAPAAAEVIAGAGPQEMVLVDVPRGRTVPFSVYGRAAGRARPLALISHGYGGTMRAYSFLANALVARGYVVASVQHELEGDPEMPTTGDPQVVRRPWWERGADNLAFVIRTLRARGIASRAPVLLVGHSNGGDSSMLFAARDPRAVAAVFSLDSRRFPFPRTRSPRICSARSSDQAADPGVLPTVEEQARLGMVIESVPLIHNDMWNGATAAQKSAMLAVLERCLAR
ncbi:MAG TPA: alpha/beta hydrolase [Allosphingosinicella sp.]|jgi:predicted dienelactone hydrolase